MIETPGDTQTAGADTSSFAAFKAQISELVLQTQLGLMEFPELSDAQQTWVETKLEHAMKQDKILKDSPRDDYEDFTEDAKDALKPAIKKALEFKAIETGSVTTRAHVLGAFYGEVHKRIKACGIKQFRGFCKFTGYSHTAVYQKVKIADCFTRESLETHPGVDVKALYVVAAKEGNKAGEALEKNYEALSRAGSDVRAVKKILDPTYTPPQKHTPEIALSPDGKIQAEFYVPGKNGRGKIVIVPTGGNVGVSSQDWSDFQVWLVNRDSLKKLEGERALEEESESEDADGATASVGNEDGGEHVLTARELFAYCEGRWSASEAYPDDGNFNIADIYGVENLADPGSLKGEVFIQYTENGEEDLIRENIVAKRFPLTSQQFKEQLEKITNNYPHVTTVMFADDGEQFVVGTKIVNGSPITRWGYASNA